MGNLIRQFGAQYRNRLVRVVSRVDGMSYDVVRSANQVDAADLLARTRRSLLQVMQHVRIMVDRGMDMPENVRRGITLLLSHYPTNTSTPRLNELDNLRIESFAFNQDKVDIYLCLRKGEAPQIELAADTTVLYIALHELAHSMCATYALQAGAHLTVHDADFRSKEAFMWGVAHKLGLLDPQTMPGTTHCGHQLPVPELSV